MVTAASLLGKRKGKGGTPSASATPAKKEAGGKPPAKSAARRGKPSAANTSSFHYFSRRNLPTACKEDKKRIHDKCDSEKGRKESKESLSNAKLDPRHAKGVMGKLEGTFKKAVTLIDGIGRTRSKYKPNEKNRWMDNHCTGLWNKPGGGTKQKPNIQDFKEQIEEKVKDTAKMYENMKSEAAEKVYSFAGNYMKQHGKDVAEGMVKKAGERALLMRFPLLNAAVAQYTRLEGLGTLIGNVAGAIATNDMEVQFNRLEEAMRLASEKLAEYTGLLESRGKLEDAMASTMAGIAKANPCIQARKCLLVPFKDTDKTAGGNGCCPGQTGHHVLPGAMFERYEAKWNEKTKKHEMKSVGPRKCWERYNHDNALTMCLEGTTNRVTNGSHGLAHFETAEVLDNRLGQQDMPYTEARDKVAGRLAAMFGCNADCIKAQLDESYRSMHDCGGLNTASVTPHSGETKGGPVWTGGASD